MFAFCITSIICYYNTKQQNKHTHIGKKTKDLSVTFKKMCKLYRCAITAKCHLNLGVFMANVPSITTSLKCCIIRPTDIC